jgi:hypothetical protein
MNPVANDREERRRSVRGSPCADHRANGEVRRGIGRVRTGEMRRPSALDRMVRDFQHNWETNAQFRAMWSGGLGLAIVVMLCACLGFAFTFASATASRFSTGGSSANAYTSAGGTPRPGGPDSTLTFPTETVPSWPAPQIPAGAPIPPSLTPAPTPTAMPTATPVPFNPGGGGGGGGGGGAAGSVSIASTNPSPLKQGAAGSVVVHTSQPNVQLIVNFTNQLGGYYPGNSPVTTDGGGNYTYSFSLPSGGCTNGSNSTLKFWIIANFPGGVVQPTITEQCAA